MEGYQEWRLKKMSQKDVKSGSEGDRGEGPSQGGSEARRLDVTREEARKAALLEAQRRYEASPKGKATRQAHDQSSERKAGKAAWNQSEKGRAAKARNNTYLRLDYRAQAYGEERPLSKEEEKNIKRLRVQDQPPGQKGAFPASLRGDEKLEQHHTSDEEWGQLHTLIVDDKKGNPSDEKRYLGLRYRLREERSPESDDTEDRGYNELLPEPEKRK
jgi:hypothetical protein